MTRLLAGTLSATLAVVVLLLVVVFIRTVVEARKELIEGDTYAAAGENRQALEHYRRALRWGGGLNPYTADAADSLRTLARDFENENQLDGALLAWRSIAGSSAAADWFYGGAPDRREEAIANIARLMGRSSAPIDMGASPSELAAEHRALLEDLPRPDPFWGSLILFGFALWIGGLILTGSRGFDATGRLNRAAAAFPFATATFGLALFVAGLIFA